jgi:hypothetical protein
LNEIIFLGGILNLENERDQPLTFIWRQMDGIITTNWYKYLN